jgi:alpha-glucosidase
VNVATEEKDPDSLLNWHRKLIELRRTSPAMREGLQVMTNADSTSVVSYIRKSPNGGPSIVVAVNCSDQPQTVSLAEGVSGPATTLVTDAPSLKTNTSLGSVTLPPYASWIGSVAAGGSGGAGR